MVHFQNRQTLIVVAVVMVLRVWAIHTRSRLILGALLILFSLEIVSTIVATAFYSDPSNVLGMYTPAE